MVHPIFNTIDKPTLLLNEEIARRNIYRIAEKARRSGLRFRPHFKTHQSAEIGAWFREEGVTAITVSSVEMAEYFAAHGWDDITIAFPVNVRQGASLAALAQRVRLGLLVESVESARRLREMLPAPVDAWMKVDTGTHRTGLPWDHPEEVAPVAQALLDSPNLHLRGLLTHAGNTYGARGAVEVCRRYAESTARMDSLRCALRDIGLHGLEVSVGDTPGASLCDNLGPVDEVRPGNFVFYDSQQIQIGSCGWQDVAAVLACPVVARHPERSEIVIYGGAVHLSKDFLMEDERRVYGYVALPDETGWSAPLEDAYVSAVSQEHGIIRMLPSDLEQVQVGDLLCVLPAHVCLTVTLMKRYLSLAGSSIQTMNG